MICKMLEFLTIIFFLEKYYLEQNERPDKELVIAYVIQLIIHTLPTRLH